jgi:hypothetical protein
MTCGITGGDVFVGTVFAGIGTGLIAVAAFGIGGVGAPTGRSTRVTSVACSFFGSGASRWDA